MNPNAAGPPPGFFAGMIVCILIVIGVALLIQILFLLNLHRTLAVVRERNREMSPGLVWLTLIPLFGNIWAVIMAPKISNSLEREYESRGRQTSGEGFARTSGMIWAWGGIVSIVLSIIQNVLQFADQAALAMVVSVLSLPISLGILICFILFWVQTYQYRKQLERGPSAEEQDYDDRYDRGDRDRDRDRRDDDDYDRGRDRRDDDLDRDRPRRDDFDR